MVKYLFSGLMLAEAVAQSPIDMPFEPWLRAGSQGFMAIILWWIVTKTIPAKDAAHAEERKSTQEAQAKAMDALREDLNQDNARTCEAIVGVQAAVEGGTARQCELLSQALWPRQKQ